MPNQHCQCPCLPPLARQTTYSHPLSLHCPLHTYLGQLLGNRPASKMFSRRQGKKPPIKQSTTPRSTSTQRPTSTQRERGADTHTQSLSSSAARAAASATSTHVQTHTQALIPDIAQGGAQAVYNPRTCRNSLYVGDLVDNKRDGQGVCRWDDGNIYTGAWKGKA